LKLVLRYNINDGKNSLSVGREHNKSLIDTALSGVTGECCVSYVQDFKDIENMEFGLDTSEPVKELSGKHTEQQKVTELSDDDLALLSSLHRSLCIQLSSFSWFRGDRTLLPKINVVWPYLLGYRTAAFVVHHCAHVLSK